MALPLFLYSRFNYYLYSCSVFAFNFHFNRSLTNVLVPVEDAADYELVLSSDDEQYGGQGLVAHMTYSTKEFDGKHYVELYLPARTAIVLKEKKHKKAKKTI